MNVLAVTAVQSVSGVLCQTTEGLVGESSAREVGGWTRGPIRMGTPPSHVSRPIYSPTYDKTFG